MKFIKLTFVYGETEYVRYVNVSEILYFGKDFEDNTIIYFIHKDGGYVVKESPEKIVRMIEGGKRYAN